MLYYVVVVIAGLLGGFLARLQLKGKGLGVVSSEVVGLAGAALLAFFLDGLPLIQRARELGDAVEVVAGAVLLLAAGWALPWLTSLGLGAYSSRQAQPEPTDTGLSAEAGPEPKPEPADEIDVPVPGGEEKSETDESSEGQENSKQESDGS